MDTAAAQSKAANQIQGLFRRRKANSYIAAIKEVAAEARAADVIQGLFWRRKANAELAAIKQMAANAAEARAAHVIKGLFWTRKAHQQLYWRRKAHEHFEAMNEAAEQAKAEEQAAAQAASSRDNAPMIVEEALARNVPAPSPSMASAMVRGVPVAASSPTAAISPAASGVLSLGTVGPPVAAEQEAGTSVPADAPTAFVVEITQTTAKPDLDDSLDGQPDAETSAVPPTMKTGRSPRTAIGRRISLVEARASAMERLATRGFRDRKSGAWAVAGPEEDVKEPERTERILASPFALYRPKPVDAFQSREGFFLFRVNGATRTGRWYRIIVIFANMGFGLLSGLQPLIISAGPVAAVAQTGLVLMLQLSMALLCFHVLPDADRIISRFAAWQFLLEGLSTASLLGSSISEQMALTGANATLAAAATGVAEDTIRCTTQWCGSGGVASVLWLLMRDSGFYLAMAAMFVPMLQLLEQRFITPCFNLIKNKSANPLVLLAAAYMLAASLPKKIINMVHAQPALPLHVQRAPHTLVEIKHFTLRHLSYAIVCTRAPAQVRYWMGYEDLKASDAAASATADAGDDAVEATVHEGNDKGNDCDCEEQGEEDQQPCAPADGPALLTGEQSADAAVRASRLLARAVAAKEASGKAMAASKASSVLPEVAEESEALNLGGLRAVARLRAQQDARRRASKAAVQEDDPGGDDDGGDD